MPWKHLVDAAPYFLVEEPPPDASQIYICFHFVHTATTLRDHVTGEEPRGRELALCMSIEAAVSRRPLSEGVSSNLATKPASDLREERER